MKIYISGPITGAEDYIEKFNETEEYLADRGYSVINPAKVYSSLPSDTLHADFIEMRYIMMEMADSIYMMSGWEGNKFSCIEYGYAKAKNIHIITEYWTDEDARKSVVKE